MSSVTRPIALATALTTAFLLAGCGASADDAGNGRPAAAAFYPLAWVTGRVAGDGWTVENLTQPGQEPHDLTLDVAQTAALERAELVVLEEGFQPAVDETASQRRRTGARRRLGRRPDARLARGPRGRDRGGARRGGPRARRRRPPLLARPAPGRRLRRRRRRRAGRGGPRRRRHVRRQRRRPAQRPGGPGRRLHRGPGRLRAHHRGRQPPGVLLPRPLRTGLRGHRRALPRRRADGRRPGAARAARRQRRGDDRLLRAAGQRQDGGHARR